MPRPTAPGWDRDTGWDEGWDDDPAYEAPPPASHRRTSGRGRRPPRRRNWRPHLPQRRWSRLLSAVIIVVLIPIAWSVGNAMTYAGGGSFSQRLAEWARDHYLSFVVTLAEQITYQPPKVGGKPGFSLAGPSAPVSKAKHNTKAIVAFAPPATLRSFAGKPLPGEGVWRVLGSVHGEPAIYGTYLRFSRVYSSYVAGIASMNQSLLKFELRPGTLDPGAGNWGAPAYIPPGTRQGLMATFNSGFRINVSGGGFYLNGHTDGTLTPGIASMVYYRDGRIAIGIWDKTVRMTSQVVGVRQNLHLIVQNGVVPSSVDYNVESSWGATLGGGYNVWRSGIGITKDGRVIWVYGPALDVRELASLLRRAGAVTGMQLDINPAWMSYEYYRHNNRANPTPKNLLPTQQEPADRYYFPNSRDFIAVYAK